MKNLGIACTGLLASGIALADNLGGADEILCAAGQTQICYQSGECSSVAAGELSIPDFVVIDTKKKSVSTTKASGLNRSTSFSSVERSDGKIYLQGIEGERAFSFIIDESSGHMIVAIRMTGSL